MTTDTTYYRPTPGDTPGHWNVWHRHPHTALDRRDIPFAELPPQVQAMIQERSI